MRNNRVGEATGRRFQLISTCSLGLLAATLVAAAGAAVADDGDIDNLVPSARYSPHCNQIASGDWNNATVCQTDNRDVYYYMDSGGDYELEQDDKDKVATALQNEYVPTDLNIYYDSSPVFSLAVRERPMSSTRRATTSPPPLPGSPGATTRPAGRPTNATSPTSGSPPAAPTT